MFDRFWFVAWLLLDGSTLGFELSGRRSGDPAPFATYSRIPSSDEINSGLEDSSVTNARTHRDFEDEVNLYPSNVRNEEENDAVTDEDNRDEPDEFSANTAQESEWQSVEATNGRYPFVGPEEVPSEPIETEESGHQESSYFEEERGDPVFGPKKKKAAKHRDRFGGRRFFLEPLIDGAILGSLGILFSEETKREADRERIEREKAREQELLDKYTRMLNDPVGFSILAEEAANSPTYVNQYVRRSLVPHLHKRPPKTHRGRYSSVRNPNDNERTTSNDCSTKEDDRNSSRRRVRKNLKRLDKNRFVRDIITSGYRKHGTLVPRRCDQ